MQTFSKAETEYLGEQRLARLATVDSSGAPHVVPVGMWHVNSALGTIDVTGRDFAGTQKFRNVKRRPVAALVVDDMASFDPWRPRAVMITGSAEAVEPSGEIEALIRITPQRVVSWGLEEERGPDV